MFINSCRIFYKESSEDPVFPAEDKWDSDRWYNYDGKARPLACIDWTEVCTHDDVCSPPYQTTQDFDRSYVFTRYAMNKSTAFDAIYFQGASGLDAQDKIIDDTSLPLSTERPQWVTESWNIFNASLARIQHDALDIANGADSHRGSYVPQMPSRFQDDMCGIFAFRIPKGYNNIHVVWLGLVQLGFPLLLFLMAIETKEDFDEEKKESGWFGESTLLSVEWLYCKAAGCCLNRQQTPPNSTRRTSSSQSQQRSQSADTNSYGTTPRSLPPPQRPEPSSSATTTGVPQRARSESPSGTRRAGSVPPMGTKATYGVATATGHSRQQNGDRRMKHTGDRLNTTNYYLNFGQTIQSQD